MTQPPMSTPPNWQQPQGTPQTPQPTRGINRNLVIVVVAMVFLLVAGGTVIALTAGDKNDTGGSASATAQPGNPAMKTSGSSKTAKYTAPNWEKAADEFGAKMDYSALTAVLGAITNPNQCRWAPGDKIIVSCGVSLENDRFMVEVTASYYGVLDARDSYDLQLSLAGSDVENLKELSGIGEVASTYYTKGVMDIEYLHLLIQDSNLVLGVNVTNESGGSWAAPKQDVVATAMIDVAKTLMPKLAAA